MSTLLNLGSGIYKSYMKEIDSRVVLQNLGELNPEANHGGMVVYIEITCSS